MIRTLHLIVNPKGGCGQTTIDQGGLVARDIIDETPEIWGEEYSTDSTSVERDYDTFAETGNYDETFDEWGYVGPETAAAILKNYVPSGSRILDAACGSGLTVWPMQFTRP